MTVMIATGSSRGIWQQTLLFSLDDPKIARMKKYNIDNNRISMKESALRNNSCDLRSKRFDFKISVVKRYVVRG
jgi:hypothetical protein